MKTKFREMRDLLDSAHQPGDTIPGRRHSLRKTALTHEVEERFLLDVRVLGARDPDLDVRGTSIARADTFKDALRALPQYAHAISQNGAQSLVSLQHRSPPARFRVSENARVYLISVAGKTVPRGSQSPRDGLRIALECPLEPSLVLLMVPSLAYRIQWVFHEQYDWRNMVDVTTLGDRFSVWRTYVSSVTCFYGRYGDLFRYPTGVIDGLDLMCPITIDPRLLRWYSAKRVEEVYELGLKG